MKRSVFIICIIFLTATTSWSQNYVPLSFSAGWKVQSNDTPFNIPGESSSMQFIRLGIGMAHPMNLERGQLVTGFRYDRLIYQFDGWPTLLEPPHIMHHARLEIVGIRNFQNGFEGTLFVAPGFATSFSEPVSVDDLNLSLAFLLATSAGKAIKFGLGLSYITNRIPAVLPLVQFNWDNGAGLAVQALLPSNTQIWYSLAPRLSGGISYRGQIAPYHVGTAEQRSYADFRRQLLTVAPALRFAISTHTSIQLEAGTPIKNRLILDGSAGELEVDHERGLFVWAGLVLHR